VVGKESLLAFVKGNIYGVDSSKTVTTVASASSYSPDAQMYSCQVADKLFYANYISSNRIGQLTWSGAAWEVRGVHDGPTNSKYLVNNNFRIFAVQPSDNQVYVSDILPGVTGGVDSLTITEGGTGYSAGTLSATGGGGSSFAGTYTVDGGVIKTVTITNAGTGYTSLPTIVPSDSGDGNADITPAFTTVFPTANAFKVGLGDPITGLASWVGFNVVVFCKNSCYVIDTNPVPATASPTVPAASTFKIRTISTSSGCLSHGSIAQVGEDLYYLSRTGVRSIRRTMEENMVASDVGIISYPIQDVIDTINWTQAQLATGIWWRGRYMLSVPTGASTKNDTTLVYNTNTQSWMGVWRGDVTVSSGTPSSYINPVDYAVTQFAGGKPFLISLDKVGNPLQFRDFVEDINLVDTDFQDKTTTTFRDTGWEATTRAFTFGEQMTTKDAEFVEFEFSRGDAVIDIGVLLDNEADKNLADELDTGTGELRLDFTLPSTLGSSAITRFRYSMTQYPEFRELQFNFRQSAQAGSDSKYLALRSVHVGGFLNSVGVES